MFESLLIGLFTVFGLLTIMTLALVGLATLVKPKRRKRSKSLDEHYKTLPKK